MTQMTVQSTREAGHTRICLSGPLQAESAGVLKVAVRRELAANRTVFLLHVGDVEFVNSGGLGALISVLKEVRLAGGYMVLCNLSRHVREVFELTQLADIFDLHATEVDAVQALHQLVSAPPAWSAALREVSP
jgi:anti-sigma B factor antagonist